MQTGDGAIIGQKGVKYGLQKPVVKGSSAAQAPAPARRPAANIFGDESDEEDVETQIKRQADKKRAAAKVCCSALLPCITWPIQGLAPSTTIHALMAATS
jgi:hypothetical protein